MSAVTPRHATTQVSEFAQRQLNEGVIDMAAGQVSFVLCHSSLAGGGQTPPPAWRIAISGWRVRVLTGIAAFSDEYLAPCISWLCC
jgi:hypothetical protein